MRYALVNADNVVDNVILWDGETPYDPGDLLVVPDDLELAEPGGTYDPKGGFAPAGPVAIVAPTPTPADKLLTQLIDKLVEKAVFTQKDADDVTVAAVAVGAAVAEVAVIP